MQKFKPRLGIDVDGTRAVMIPDDTNGVWVSAIEAELALETRDNKHAGVVAALQEQVQKLAADNAELIELYRQAVMPATDAVIREIGAKAVDARMEWLESMNTLHGTVEMLYVVDGYQLTYVYHDCQIGETAYGATLAESIDNAIAAGWKPMNRAGEQS